MKVKRSLLADLERNDLSRWPPGIFQRALIRQYAHAVGLSDAVLVEDFRRAFPEAADAPSQAHSELRLTLADRRFTAVYRRIVNARSSVTNALAILAASGGVAFVSGWPYWTIAAAIALTWPFLRDAGFGAMTSRLRRRSHSLGSRSLKRMFAAAPNSQLELRPGTDSLGARFPSETHSEVSTLVH